jgi:hypothetical protein
MQPVSEAHDGYVELLQKGLHLQPMGSVRPSTKSFFENIPSLKIQIKLEAWSFFGCLYISFIYRIV